MCNKLKKRKKSELHNSGDTILMYPAGCGAAKVKTDTNTQELLPLTNKVRFWLRSN